MFTHKPICTKAEQDDENCMCCCSAGLLALVAFLAGMLLKTRIVQFCIDLENYTPYAVWIVVIVTVVLGSGYLIMRHEY